ncbi:MAG TPA: phosphomannomutase [Methylotenera sp.]|nr:phosphomannomutase [Methylotenera sp.]HPH06324.1 phosphomannomutase [Methylotenera sp.]HPN00331.1 phosphomannomutase [Methylotenera sp.]
MKVTIQHLMQTSGVQFGTSGARGLVSAMTDEVCFAYTLAFLQAIQATKGQRIALATDLRPSSPTIAAAVAAAIQHAGLQVDFCGAIPTPALAYYAQTQGIAGIVVTGSHIPFDRNGIKFYSAVGEITKQDETNISLAEVTLPEANLSVALPSVNHAAQESYLTRYLSYFPTNIFIGMRLGFYQHSSVARDLLTNLLQKLGAEVIVLGRTNEFVPLDTEAVAPDDITRAKNWAKEHQFDAIFSTDGDADRPLIGDENGQWMRGDIVGLLCAQYLQAQAVATPVSCNTSVEKCGSFAQVKRTRIGSPYVIVAMEQLQAAGAENIVGYEANGGFLLGSEMRQNGQHLAPLKTRDAALPILAILAMAKAKQCKVSELIKLLPTRFTASDRLQAFPTQKSRELLARFASSSAELNTLLKPLGGVSQQFDQTDGLRITLNNGEIVHFRPSGNAPELRCYAEADSQTRADALVSSALAEINNLL